MTTIDHYRVVLNETALGSRVYLEPEAPGILRQFPAKQGEVLKFGLRYCNSGPYVRPDRAVELLQAAEQAGFDSAWTAEHVLIPPAYDSSYPYTADGRIPGIDAETNLPDPLVWMAYCAARTSVITLGTAMIVLPMRNPVLLAKEAATFDNLTNGRLILGVGVGWLKEEFDALNSAFDDRGRRTDEYIDLMRHLWGEQETPIRGDFDLTGLNIAPKPVNGSIPIHIGGDTPVAARRAGRRGDGYFPGRRLTPELMDVMRRAANEAGRDEDAIEVTVSMPDEESQLERLATMGVYRVAVPVTGEAGLRKLVDSPEKLESWAPLISKYA